MRNGIKSKALELIPVEVNPNQFGIVPVDLWQLAPKCPTDKRP
jgi:hypothetical protein